MEESNGIRCWGISSEDLIRRTSVEGMDSHAEQLMTLDWNEAMAVGKTGLNFRECEALVEKAQVFIREPLQGVGVDLGSGVGTLAAVLTRQPAVKQVYAVEYSRLHVEKVMPRSLPAMKADMNKIVRCWGSFNEVPVPDGFFDFVTEFAAFHHSEDLPQTLAEAYRILKPGGWLIAVETPNSAKPNHFTDADIQAVLGRPWGHKDGYGGIADEITTRGEWGEHLYRFCDWLHFFAGAGFESYSLIFRSYSRRSLKNLVLEGFLRLFGDSLLRRRVTDIPYLSWFERGCNRPLFLCRRPARV